MTAEATRAVVNWSELPLHRVRQGERFEVGLGDIDQPLGLSGLGATLHVVAAGKTAWPYHRHHGNDKEPPSVFSVAGRLSPLGYWEGEES